MHLLFRNIFENVKIRIGCDGTVGNEEKHIFLCFISNAWISRIRALPLLAIEVRFQCSLLLFQ